MLRKAEFVILLLLSLLFNSCYYQSQNKTNAWDIYNDVGNESFFSLHHYSQNSNFIVVADSIVLICQQPDELPFDSLTIYKDDCIVVADVMQLPINEDDSVWVKVARDQYTQGWISERKLLSMVVPPDPVSYFISLFSYVPLLFIITTVLFLVITYYKKKVCNHDVYFVHINDIKSFYPTLLTVLIAIASVYYATLKMVDFETCRHFYFYPSLNPFDLPLQLCLLIMLSWLIFIVLIATIEEVFKKLNANNAVVYLIGLLMICLLNFLVYTILTPYYIGYFLLVIYILWSYKFVAKMFKNKFICGNCGQELIEKGVCPKCNYFNK